ncbi:DUF134 domain-containing protein [bacterium]|nr:DUF134 domain-containing protein [bacterium]
MPRPHKTRRIGGEPSTTVFKPAGAYAHDLTWIELAIDEYEALRLVDYEGADQESAATELGVSRPTVTRILARARRKLAQMLAEGCALVIQGGPVHYAASDAPCGPGRGRGYGRGGRSGHGGHGRGRR